MARSSANGKAKQQPLSAKPSGVTKPARVAPPPPVVSAAIFAALAVSQLSELVGCKVDVPNAAWKGYTDGGFFTGLHDGRG